MSCLHPKIGTCLFLMCTLSDATDSIEDIDTCTGRAKKVVSDSLGLVDFATGLVNSVLSLPDVQVKFFEEFKLQQNCEINSAYQNVFGAS